MKDATGDGPHQNLAKTQIHRSLLRLLAGVRGVSVYSPLQGDVLPGGSESRLPADRTISMSRANSTYEAAMLKLARYGRRGLSLHAHYTYAHAMDWNPNESPMWPATTCWTRQFQPGVRNQQPRRAPLGRRHVDL